MEEEMLLYTVSVEQQEQRARRFFWCVRECNKEFGISLRQDLNLKDFFDASQ